MRAWWLDAKAVRAYRLQDQARLFKWVAFERGGEMQLVAMPYDAGLVFHMEAVAELARRKGWCDDKGAKAFLKRQGNEFAEAGIRVYGGGVRFESGATRNYSYRFGPVHEKYHSVVLERLGLTA